MTPNDLVPAESTVAVTVREMMTVEEHRSEMQARQKFVRDCLVKGKHYLTIPGTDKDTLVKPGAEEVLAHFYCRPSYALLPQSVIDWQSGFCAFFYKCQAIHMGSGTVMGEGEGSCNSAEERYGLRHDRPACDCGHELRKSKEKDEYYCWRKQGGCGKVYPAHLIKETGGKRETTRNEWATQVNTIQKMAEKRAMVACALTLGGLSELFTQDVEDTRNSPIEGEYRELEDSTPATRKPTTRATPADVPTSEATPVAETTPAPTDAATGSTGGRNGDPIGPIDRSRPPFPRGSERETAFATIGAFFQAALATFKLNKSQVLAALGVTDQSEIDDLQAAWERLEVKAKEASE